jgi:hypothetical protein
VAILVPVFNTISFYCLVPVCTLAFIPPRSVGSVSQNERVRGGLVFFIIRPTVTNPSSRFRLVCLFVCLF